MSSYGNDIRAAFKAEKQGNGQKEKAKMPKMKIGFKMPTFGGGANEPAAAQDPHIEEKIRVVAGVKDGASEAASSGIAYVVGNMMLADDNARQVLAEETANAMETLAAMSRGEGGAFGVTGFEIPEASRREISAIVKASVFTKLVELMPDSGGDVARMAELTRLVTLPRPEDKDPRVEVLRPLTDEEWKLVRWDSRKATQNANETQVTEKERDRKRLLARMVGAGRKRYILCEGVSREGVVEGMTAFTRKWDAAVDDRKDARQDAYSAFRSLVPEGATLEVFLETPEGEIARAYVKNTRKERDRKVVTEAVVETDGKVVWPIAALGDEKDTFERLMRRLPRRELPLSFLREAAEAEGAELRDVNFSTAHPSSLDEKRGAIEAWREDIVTLGVFLKHGGRRTLSSERFQASCDAEEAKLAEDLKEAGVDLRDEEELADRKGGQTAGGCVPALRRPFTWEHCSRVETEGEERKRYGERRYSRLSAAVSFNKEGVTVHGWPERADSFFAPGLEGVTDVERGKTYPNGQVPHHLIVFLQEWRKQVFFRARQERQKSSA